MDFLERDPKKLYTLTEFTQMDVVEDENLDGRARVVISYSFGDPICLAGFSADPHLSNFEIQEEAYHYYLKLRRVILANRPKLWKD